MLYVSRVINLSKFGVVDTDDGVEQIVTKKDLHDACIKHGLHVEGVVIGEGWHRGKKFPCIMDVKVCQDPNSGSGKHAKLRMLEGVDIKTYNGEIVSISWVPGQVGKNTVINLSSYGKKCGRHLLNSCPLAPDPNHPVLLLVLDDSISLDETSFETMIPRGIAVDVRAVTSEKILRCVYSCVVRYRDILSDMHVYVIDFKERQDYYRGVAVLNAGLGEYMWLSAVVTDPKAISEKIAKNYSKSFATLSKQNFVPRRKDTYSTYAGDFCYYMRNYRYYLDLDDGDLFRKDRFIVLFDAMAVAAKIDAEALMRLKHFALYFERVPEVEESFIRFCQRAGKWMVEHGKQQGWI